MKKFINDNIHWLMVLIFAMTVYALVLSVKNRKKNTRRNSYGNTSGNKTADPGSTVTGNSNSDTHDVETHEE